MELKPEELDRSFRLFMAREDIKRTGWASCYYCGKRFKEDEIYEWIILGPLDWTFQKE